MSNAADTTLKPETAPQPVPDRATSSRAVTELGVVDPIRIPPALRGAGSRTAAAARATWGRLPLLGQVFVTLSLLDVLWRAVGFAGTSLFIFLEAPISLIAAFFPHNLLIALPALILARRPDAAEATPLVLRGAILLALVELLAQPLANAGYGPGANSFITGAAVTIAALLLKSIGWLAVAFGLSAITIAKPGPAIAGLANLVFVALAAHALLQVALLLIIPPNLGDPAWDAVQGLANAMFSVEAIVFAYVARIVVRGSSDDRRPPMATALASTSVVLMAFLAAISAFLGVISLVLWAFAAPNPLAQATFSPGWIGDGLVLTLFLVAFGLGLADTSVRLPRSGAMLDTVAEAEPLDDEPSWPEPGGDVPTYRQPDPPAATAAKRASSRRRSKRQT